MAHKVWAAEDYAHQLEVLTRDRLELQEAVDQVSSQEKRLRHQLRAAPFLVIGCLRSARKCAGYCISLRYLQRLSCARC